MFKVLIIVFFYANNTDGSRYSITHLIYVGTLNTARHLTRLPFE